MKDEEKIYEERLFEITEFPEGEMLEEMENNYEKIVESELSKIDIIKREDLVYDSIDLWIHQVERVNTFKHGYLYEGVLAIKC